MPTDNPVYDIIADYEQRFIDAFQKAIEKHDKATPGTLWQSVKATTKIFGQSITLEISMLDYWKFVDSGVDGWAKSVGSEYKFKKSGKRIPLDVMKSFIAARGIPVKALKKSGLKKKKPSNPYDSAAWAMGYSVKKKGIKPTHFVKEVTEGSLVDEFKKDISTAVGRDIKIEISKEIKSSK